MQSIPPPKNYSLACWWLTYRVPVDCEDITHHIPEACKRASLPANTLAICRERWPKGWERMHAKRAVRLAYLQEQGKQPPAGWAPLPGDGRSANIPLLALRRRMKLRKSARGPRART